MPSYPQYQQQFAAELIACVSATPYDLLRARSLTAAEGDLKSLVDGLINALPSYQDMAMETVHRGALANLLEVNLPNNGIAPHPTETGPWYAYYYSSYSYDGFYSGYRDAFYHGVSQTPLASQALSQVQSANSSLNAGWWGNAGVTILTDAVRQRVSVSLDTGKLTNALSTLNSSFRTGLTASYLSVVTGGFANTAQAIQAIQAAGLTTDAANVLDQAIGYGQFTANINQALAMGGDSSNAATWFLYNLWVLLKAFNYPDVDGAIRRYQQNGLQVPAEVQASNWWNGTYSDWFAPLSGADVMVQAGSTITESMPETEMTTYSGSTFPSVTHPQESNGYSMSFTQWGSLNWYLPDDSGCCFAAGTAVLMADGSTKRIENVQVGDLVHTQLGPRQVLLVEKPPRGTRSLYGIDGLAVVATGGHPFCCADTDGPKYSAAEPWTLLDGLPTITASGVRALRQGVKLQAVDKALKPCTFELTALRLQPAATPESAQQPVYDLILEDWEEEHTAYYVGGPEIFLAVESETNDPMHTMAVTQAIVTAMKMTAPAAREHLGNPHLEFPRLLRGVDRIEMRRRALRASRPYFGGKPMPQQAKVGVNCMIQKSTGDWDPHASALEHYLVRDHGRGIRADAATGWRVAWHGDPSGQRLVVGIFDLEMIEHGLPMEIPVTLELSLRSARVDRLQDPARVPLKLRSPWCAWVDQNVDVGAAAQVTPGTVMDGTLRTEHGWIARFRATIDPDMMHQARHDVYLVAKNGTIIGRLALDVRRLRTEQIEADSKARAEWSPRHELQLARCLGQQLGNLLWAHITAGASL